jgi:hypothetical protein
MPPSKTLGSSVRDGSLKSRSPRSCRNCSTESLVTTCFSTPQFKTMRITTERPSSYARCGRETFQPRSRSRTIRDLPKFSSELNSHQIGETPSRAHVSASTPNHSLACQATGKFQPHTNDDSVAHSHDCIFLLYRDICDLLDWVRVVNDSTRYIQIRDFVCVKREKRLGIHHLT